MFLVTGCKGQLGTELHRLLGDRAVCIDRDELDITDEAAVKDFFARQSFDFVINCAAYTAVDKAEDEPELAERINCDGAAYLARYGKRIVHISTDYVFDGTGNTPYSETDSPNPVSVYGKTKLAGEIAVQAEAETAVIIRTAWLCSPWGNNFVKTMLRLGRGRDHLGVVFDQVGTPTFAADLAGAIVSLLPQIRPENAGIYHFSNEGAISWYDFAKAIMQLSGLPCRVAPIESFEYPSKAPRPAYSVLNKRKIKETFGLKIPYWLDSLQTCIEELNKRDPA